MTKELGLSYFYSSRAEQFMFFRIPKLLFTDQRFSGLSTDAKLLYGLMLDRMSLSVQNNWLDEEGRVYIYFSIEEIGSLLGCGRDKTLKLLAELDTPKGIGLIERRIRGQGKPTLIYVKDFTTGPDLQKSEKSTSRNLKSRLQEDEEADFKPSDFPTHNNTDINKTDLNHIQSFMPEETENDETRWKGEEYETYQEILSDNIEYHDLLANQNKDALAELLALMTDVVCSNRATIRVGGDEKPAAIVKAQFLKLRRPHVAFVLACLSENTTRVKNIRNYLITALYNAPMTIGNYYKSLARHDLNKGVI